MIGQRALITGATGFVGSHLVRRLVNLGMDVHIICRDSSNFWRMADVLPRVSLHRADLRDVSAVRSAVSSAHPDFIFHLAAATVVAGKTDGASELITGNLLGTVNLIDACGERGYRGMVTTGDSFEYTPSKSRLSEASACYPTALHGITKLAATLQARATARVHELPIATLRLFSTYGPADHPRRLVPRVITGALANEDLQLSRPQIERDWIFIDDLIDLYLEVATKADKLKGQVFNAGSGKATSIGDVVELILQLTGSRSTPRWGTFEAPEHDLYPWIADPEHTFSQLEWRPKTALEDGLSRTIASVRA
jgi:nucleoside-diphosphate-sugar epimerase